MMKNNLSGENPFRKDSNIKVALVTESLWEMAGSNRVLDIFAQIYPQADIFALFGNKENLSPNLKERDLRFTFLNGIPFIKKIYRYTFFLWPIAIENIDLSDYDLIISVSSSVAHGVITPMGSKHVVYLNTPMRYAWDLTSLYKEVVSFGFFKRVVRDFFLTVNRAWDVVAARRADVIIANSKFVSKRVRKYWDREVDAVIYPPSERFSGEIKKEREDYFVAGAPFEPNKRGDFLLECAKELGFNLKITGGGSMKKKLKRKYGKYPNIEFLDWISEEEKWELLSNAKGFLVGGIEDYGIFSCEAISCGTPILAYKGGGSVEIIKESRSGLFFNSWVVSEFERAMKKFNETEWKYEDIAKSLENANTQDSFKKEIISLLVE
ncbi:MAG: mannosyl transferase [candidate division WS6 bacterium 34_10]|uniref:Mannosyl transferase n=1 Tax=candidate division WS6 bacterium 34_10 TaxID=1641389 RepID=A0A101HFL1_9BACT|nr:MAG: mannosyl transferase [candidate division WS6 bacterium 34_10]